MKATICLSMAIAGLLVSLFQGTLHAQLPDDPFRLPEFEPRPTQRVFENPIFPIPKFANLLVKPNLEDDPIKKLQREQLSEALVCVEVYRARFLVSNNSADPVTDLHKFHKLAVVAAFDLAETGEQKIECLEFLVEATKLIEKIEVAKSMTSTKLGASAAKYWRLEAEINLLKFKRDLALEKPR